MRKINFTPTLVFEILKVLTASFDMPGHVWPLPPRITFVSCKTRNHPQTSQTSHKPSKPPTNQSQTSQTTHKPPKNQPNHSQTSHICDKPPKNQSIISKKSVSNVTKNFSNNAKHVLNLQPFYSISSTFSSEDQSQVRIEGK